MTKKNKSGRAEIVLTDEQIAKVEELAPYMTIEQIADRLGVSERVFYEIKKRDSAVSAVYKKGKAKGIEEVAGKLRSLIDGGDVTATIFYLKTQGGWSTENKNDNNIKISLGNKSALEILNGSLTALEKGEINISEAQQLSNLALTKMNIQNNNSLEDKIVYQQRSREELWERVKLYTMAGEKLVKQKEELEKSKHDRVNKSG